MAGRWAAVVGVLLLLPLLPLASSSMVFKLDGNVYPTGYVHDLLSTSSISLWCRPKRCQMQKAIISVYSVLSCKRMVLFVCLQFQQTSEMQQFGLCFFFSVTAQPLLRDHEHRGASEALLPGHWHRQQPHLAGVQRRREGSLLNVQQGTITAAGFLFFPLITHF